MRGHSRGHPRGRSRGSFRGPTRGHTRGPTREVKFRGSRAPLTTHTPLIKGVWVVRVRFAPALGEKYVLP